MCDCWSDGRRYGLSVLDGIGSNMHVVEGLHVRSLETSLSVRGVKEGNNEPVTVVPVTEETVG